MLESGLIASRFLHYVAVLSLFGVALFPLYIFRGRLSSFAEDEPKLAAWMRWLLLCAVLVALVSGVAWFEFTTGMMADGASAMMQPSVLMTMMMGTDFGPLWAARLILLLGIAGLLIRWPSKLTLSLVPLLAALALASLAGTGHARATQGIAGIGHIASDALHLIASGLWLGGLWPLGAVIVASFRCTAKKQEELGIGEILRRFSSVATVAVLVLVATGVLNSWFLVGSPFALFSSLYGELLFAKIILFVFMALLASANRFWITPHLKVAGSPSSEIWLSRLRWRVIAEHTLGLAVLALVSYLGTLQPTIIQ